MTAAWPSRLIAGTILIVLTFFVMPCLHADIYVYIDKEGVFHFTNVPTSEKYKVYMRESAPKPKFAANSKVYDDVISEAARQNGLDFPLLKALIHVESYFNPRAVSKKGAMGLTQIMPETSQLLNINDPFDPWENIMGGARYLRAMLERFDGQMGLALAAYNAGPTAVERYNTIPPFKETREYVEKVLKLFRHYHLEVATH
jgi:soluble lytic murein transglycosylase-like protein